MFLGNHRFAQLLGKVVDVGAQRGTSESVRLEFQIEPLIAQTMIVVYYSQNILFITTIIYPPPRNGHEMDMFTA